MNGVSIGSDNGLSPIRRQASIIHAGTLLTRTLGANFSEILSEVHIFSFKKMHLKMSSAKTSANLFRVIWVKVNPWWRHQMETFSALLAICAGNSPVPGEFPTQRPVTRSFDVYFDLRPNGRLSKQSWGWWFETLSRSLWRHRNAMLINAAPGDFESHDSIERPIYRHVFYTNYLRAWLCWQMRSMFIY